MSDFSTFFSSTEVERVIDGSEVRTVNLKAVLAFFDSPTFDFSMTNIFLDNPVPVMGLDDTQIGYCTVSLKGVEGAHTGLVADVFIRYDSQERLLLENDENLFAKVNGSMHVTSASFKGALELFSVKMPVLSIHVDSISLQRAPLVDTRVPALGKEIL